MKPHLFGLFAEELAAHLRANGVAVRDAEARRIVAHAVAHPVANVEEGFPRSRPVPRAVEHAVTQLVDRRPLEIIERATDPNDGFVKYLFRLHDGALAEAVRIPLEVEGRYTVCLSSQAGCAMACDFCATGRLGLTRNLEAWEMVGQFLGVREELRAEGGERRAEEIAGMPLRPPLSALRPQITGAVFQGQGEPLHNYANVMKAAELLSHPCGGRISSKAITISTVGLVPMIHRYAKEKRPYRLIVSLTSAIDERRRSLVPAASAWPVRELAEAVRAYQRSAGGRVTIAWVVMGGINHGSDEVEALRELFADVPLRLNLIDINVIDVPYGTARGVYRRATDAELGAFRDELRSLGVPVVRRYSGGAARHAACGMLAATRA